MRSPRPSRRRPSRRRGLGAAVALSTAAFGLAVTAPSAARTSAPGMDRTGAAPGAVGADTVSFAEDVLPIFQQRCAQCHGGTDDNGEVVAETGLVLLEYEKVLAGSEFGTVVEPGNAEDSWLLELIVQGDMPQEGDPVPPEEIALIRAWIEAGAPNN